MIDRGDLAAENWAVWIIRRGARNPAFTKGVGKPLIMATENLESMMSRDVPSKSELCQLLIQLKLELIASC